MASVYTTNNGIELIGTGEKSGTWGTITNQNFEIIDTALDGQINIELASAGSSGSPNTVNISEGQGVSDGNNRMFIFTDGASFSGDAYVQLTPNDAEKIVYIRNNFSSSSPHSIVIFQGNYDAANSYTLPRGKTAVIYFDGEGLGAVASNMFDNAHFDALNIVGNADVGGNLTVTGDVVTGDDLSLQSDGAVLNFGADNDVSLTHVADTAIRLNSDKALQFRDAAISIASSADGKLQIDADTEVEINTTTLDINATTLNVPPNSITLGTDTVGDYVSAVGVGDGLTRYGDANGENAVPILRLATAYGDDVNPYGEKGLNLVLASPATHPGIGVPALPTFRSLVAADLPTLSLGTHTSGNYVQSLATTSPILGGAAGSEGPNLTISLATTYGDDQNPYGIKNPNSVLAGSSDPNSFTPPSFRFLTEGDIPALNIYKVSGLQSALDGKLGSGSNAVSASKWQTARTITFTGDVSGSFSIDGQSDVTLSATVDKIANVTTQDFKNSGNFKSYNFENFSEWGSTTAIRRETFARHLTVWKDRYVLIGYVNTDNSNEDTSFKVFDLETETMHTVKTRYNPPFGGTKKYLYKPYVLQNLDGSPCSIDGNSFFVVSGSFYFNRGRKKIVKITATDSNPDNWTRTTYGSSDYTTHSRYPSTNSSYPTYSTTDFRGYTISPNAVVKGNILYCVAYYQFHTNKYIGKLLKLDTSTDTLTETDILSLVEGAGWSIPYELYNLDFYGNDRDPDRYIGITLAGGPKIRGAAVYDITDNHFETTVQYDTLRGTSAWSGQVISGPILPNGDIIICPNRAGTSSTDATVGIYNLNPNSAGMLEVDLKQGHGADHDWTSSAFDYPRFFCDSKIFPAFSYDYTSTNSAPIIFDTSSLSAKQFTRGNIGAHTSNVTAHVSSDAFVTVFCPKPLSDGRRIVLQHRYDITYSSNNYDRERHSDKILTVFKPER